MVWNRLRPARFGFVALLLAGTGCGYQYDVTPSSDSARSALDKALTTWKEGGRPGTIAGMDPPVEAVDSYWKAGRKLSGYEILREEGSEADRRFVVRLTQPEPPREQEIPYRVIGKGPVWVYREEDYNRAINMDNSPLPKATKAKRR